MKQSFKIDDSGIYIYREAAIEATVKYCDAYTQIINAGHSHDAAMAYGVLIVMQYTMQLLVMDEAKETGLQG